MAEVDAILLEQAAAPTKFFVKVGATSAIPIDWKIRRGDLKDRMPLGCPVILGLDVADEVVETAAMLET